MYPRRSCEHKIGNLPDANSRIFAKNSVSVWQTPVFRDHIGAWASGNLSRLILDDFNVFWLFGVFLRRSIKAQTSHFQWNRLCEITNVEQSKDNLMNAVEVLTKLELSRCWILICTLYFNISKGEVIGSVRETRSCRVESPARRSPSPESLRKQVFSQTSQCSEHRSDWRWWPWGMDSGGVNFELWFVSFDERTGAQIGAKHRFSKCHMNQNPQNFPAAYRRPGNYIT